MSVALPEDPAREDLILARPTLWVNPNLASNAINEHTLPVSSIQVAEAEANWSRLAPLLNAKFPELTETNGRIGSSLIEAEKLRESLGYGDPKYGRIFVKSDGELPIAGSIKARGGIYEVYMFAEQLARELKFLQPTGDLTLLASESAREMFGEYTISVGSTGNLGLSVGIAARSLGFKSVVHMSSDAKRWKVERLQRIGVHVVTHETDYTAAVEAARAEASQSRRIHFVDDERSRLLFFGYSAAARELEAQLEQISVRVDSNHPLFVYLPCGIGGAPGGLTFGLKAKFGDAMHCFFVEPVQSPCAIVHMMSGSENLVSVYDVGLSNRTEADGLAVPRMSAFVADTMKPMLSGVITVDDEDLFRWLWQAYSSQSVQLEPSATAGFAGPKMILGSERGQKYLIDHKLESKTSQATHILWTTGGALVPQEQFDVFLERGRAAQ